MSNSHALPIHLRTTNPIDWLLHSGDPLPLANGDTVDWDEHRTGARHEGKHSVDIQRSFR
jgi:hypothetical protein